MDPEALAKVAAFSSAFSPLAPVAAERDETERPALLNPAEVLAALMDFSGSVALAELLAADPPSGPKNPAARAHGERLTLEIRARLDALLPLALKPLTGRRAPSVPDPHELFALVREHAPEGVPGEDAARRLAEELGAPLRSALSTSLRQAQAHVATLRWQIAHEVRALGPRAERLERIDAALQRSIQGKLGELLDRMEHAAGLTFERACVHACSALPDHFGPDHLAAWTGRDGWIERFRERSVRMARALFGHLRRSLDGLLRAAIHAEEA